MRNYFIRYNPKANINYLYLFMLYGIAEYDKVERRYNTIHYNTKKELAAKIAATYGKSAMSLSTISRLMNNTAYNDYYTIGYNKIILNNNFTNYNGMKHTPFIVITDDEAKFFIEQRDKLLARYYCYLKYYCSYAQLSGSIQDFTAKQFLDTIGLSLDNHNNLSKISGYNTLLVNNGYIKIEKYRDKYGYERNKYTIL